LRAALDLLCGARVCHRVPCTAARGVPLGAEVRSRVFKCLFLDVGLSSTSLGLDLLDAADAGGIGDLHRGGTAEQAVGQLLRLHFPPNAAPESFFWRRDRRGAEAEVDFVIARGSRVLPVEVKAGAAGSLRSLHAFVAERGLDLAVRVQDAPPEIREVRTAGPGQERRFRLLSVPPYLVEEIPRLVEALR
ncbi:MAG: DUF4143 domain-containing protein, partial [Planctomycetaceae bacterium]|nr:DUF4143 domain-containing protein [Planctomycetaceae bacterium]